MCLADIEFTSDDIVVVIDDLDNFAATADEDIPAKILKGCKHELARSFTMLWKRSMTSGKVPPSLKEQFITPIYKKDPKLILLTTALYLALLILSTFTRDLLEKYLFFN